MAKYFRFAMAALIFSVVLVCGNSSSPLGQVVDGKGAPIAKDKTIAKPVQTIKGSVGKRYTKDKDGVISDSITGLEWYAGPDRDTNWNQANAWTENLTAAGGGWRMPTTLELKTLYQEGVARNNIDPIFQTTGFWGWSGERKGASSARIVLFNFGNLSTPSLEFSKGLRAFAVRGNAKSSSLEGQVVDGKGAPTAKDKTIAKPVQPIKGSLGKRYTKDKDGVISDSVTGLEWYIGPDRHTTWNQGKAWTESLSAAGGGWRMPTTLELKALVQKGTGSQNMDPIFQTTGFFVWSGELKDASSPLALSTLYDGREGWDGITTAYSGRAFAVRSRIARSVATDAVYRPETDNPVVRLEITCLHESSNRQGRSSGTGFFVTHDGYIVTNDHVVHPIVEKERWKTQSVKVRVNQGQRDEHVVTGTIFSSDPVADLAVVKISGSTNRPVLPLSAPRTLQPGTPVRAQGYPLGGPYKETNGIVIADLPAKTGRPTGVILCSAPVQPGNSGGPVLDGQGKVIGVAVARSNVELLKDVKQVQDAAADALTKMRAALAEASKKMKAQGDKDGYGARMDAMGKKAKASLDKHAEQSWVLSEAVKYPNKTHVIPVADVNRLLDKWRVMR